MNGELFEGVSSPLRPRTKPVNQRDDMPRKVGRPRLYATDAARKRAHRARQRAERERLQRSPKKGTKAWWAKSQEQMERYTPVTYIEAVRQVLGTIDLDPASCAVAQQTVQASRYWTIDDNGLAHAWAGRTFLNPPYVIQLIDHFVTRLVEEVQHGHVVEAILLVNNCTETTWFQQADAAATRRCEPKGRIKFVDSRGQRTDPQRGSVFFYFGSNPERFTEIFAPFGPIR
jgi:hypothetical protein